MSEVNEEIRRSKSRLEGFREGGWCPFLVSHYGFREVEWTFECWISEAFDFVESESLSPHSSS